MRAGVKRLALAAFLPLLRLQMNKCDNLVTYSKRHMFGARANRTSIHMSGISGSCYEVFSPECVLWGARKES